MDTSSYLLMSKRKKLKFLLRVMEKQSSTASDISADSLETNYKRKPPIKEGVSDENVDTILVPFYEKDVLIKVPKEQKRKQPNAGNKLGKSKDLQKKDSQQPNSYLVNRDKEKSKRTSYLEMFRKQFAPNKLEQRVDRNDTSSLLPEFGDSERESFGEDINNPPAEFYNTESYNEMYYEKLLNRDLEQYLESSYEALRFTNDITNQSHDDNPDNLKSVSEVSQPRRRTRRATVQPIPSMKLGGLGPDMENIKPRLDRARSLQRYSEKVRIENRLKIYKQSIQADIEKKEERELYVRRHESAKQTQKERAEDPNASYLMNKSVNEKKSKPICKTWSKSAGVQRTRERRGDTERSKEKPVPMKNETGNQKQEPKTKTESKDVEDQRKNENITKFRAKSGARNKGINTEKGSAEPKVPPVQISFMVNVGGVRPSSALKTLEEKHRMYQEQVKAFMENNL